MAEVVISLAEPTPEDLQSTSELEKVLESYNVLEDPSEREHRKEILAKLNTLFRQWVRDVSIAQNMPAAVADKLGGTIYPFGSYRLGAYDKNADIDAICVAPRNVERADYFGSFFELLKRQPEVIGCRTVKSTTVPIIEMKFDGIEIDLSFAQLKLDEVPDNFDFFDETQLDEYDHKSQHSVRGVQVTEQILRLVPNIDTFRLTLRVIKLWAKRRGIYSHILGYLSGVSWTLLVARTCQLHPNATAATLVHNFFLEFSGWDWSQAVKQITDNENFLVGFCLMTIVIPIQRRDNTANVSHSVRQMIIDELHRGKEVTDEIMLTKAAGWDKLFAAPGFFNKYRHYIVLLVSSNNANDHLRWCGLVEFKILTLIAILKRNPQIALTHVNPKRFEHPEHTSKRRSDGKVKQLCSLWFIGFEFDKPESSNVDLTKDIDDFLDNVRVNAVSSKLLKNSMKIEARHVEQEQLSEYLHPNLLMRESSPDVNSGATTRKRLPSDDEQTAPAVQSKKARTDSETPTTSSESPPDPDNN
ncbi:poly(A) polymerase type 3-like [Sabethes cyaneus]|uniref:poly(A) polymerase type 3-like n=1 Tax=Sabethes cyaneus TaxID=53552 RepID=UPI00237DE7CE|nr:poly(A) polymerase type 3-like [Sabethes cyaneus]